MSSTQAKEWTPAQKKAFSATGRTLVAAAAGSGKTSVLTELVTRSLINNVVSPSEICAVTFTKKSAEEIRERITNSLYEQGYNDLASKLPLMLIGTIHSLCTAIIRKHGASIGVDPNVTILDGPQTSWLTRNAFDHTIHTLSNNSNIDWLRSIIDNNDLFLLIKEIHNLNSASVTDINFIDTENIKIPLDKKTNNPLSNPNDIKKFNNSLITIWKEFNSNFINAKNRMNSIDFNDLEYYASKAVEIDSVRVALKLQWTLLLVDEFQDTNSRQFKLLDAIGQDKLFMVGDEWQSIYRFRGADVDVFRERRKDKSCELIPMRENFRSTAPVLDTINKIFSHDNVFSSNYEPVLAGSKQQQEVNDLSVEFLLIPKQSDLPYTLDTGEVKARHKEAGKVAERIAKLIRTQGVQPKDIAILYAKSTDINIYEDALKRWDIPTIRGVSKGFFKTDDISDALFILSVLRNQLDNYAVLSVMSGPCGNFEWNELDEIVSAAKDSNIPLFDALTSSSLPKAVQLVKRIKDLKEKANTSSLVELVDNVVSIPELELTSALTKNGAQRVANLRKLVDLAASAEGIGINNVQGFIEFVEVQKDNSDEGEATLADQQTGAVRMMTIHTSKGLEFPYVFVVEAGASDEHKSNKITPRLDKQHKIHTPIPNNALKLERTEALILLDSEEKIKDAQERKRLWYVAMTRAQKYLVISGTWDFTPKKDGGSQAKRGAIKWLQSALELDDFFGGEGKLSYTLGGSVLVDTTPAQEIPVKIFDAQSKSAKYHPPIYTNDSLNTEKDKETNQEQQAHNEILFGEKLKQEIKNLQTSHLKQKKGSEIHDAISQLLTLARSGTKLKDLIPEYVSSNSSYSEVNTLEKIFSSRVFILLSKLKAKTEVPYISYRGATKSSSVAPGVEVADDFTEIDIGRFDAIASLPSKAIWIVDWKTNLPKNAVNAWDKHKTQLLRYAQSMYAVDTSQVFITLSSISEPSLSFTWLIDSDNHHKSIDLSVLESMDK